MPSRLLLSALVRLPHIYLRSPAHERKSEPSRIPIAPARAHLVVAKLSVGLGNRSPNRWPGGAFFAIYAHSLWSLGCVAQNLCGKETVTPFSVTLAFGLKGSCYIFVTFATRFSCTTRSCDACGRTLIRRRSYSLSSSDALNANMPNLIAAPSESNVSRLGSQKFSAAPDMPHSGSTPRLGDATLSPLIHDRSEIVPAEVVCLVDDDPSILKSVGRLLESDGFRVSAFSEPEAFLEYVTANSVALVVLDVWMNKMTGMELFAHLCARSPGTRVIFITAHEDHAAQATVMQGGAFAFFIKPFDGDQFLKTVHDALGHSLVKSSAAA